jgi:3-hydroxyacyl-CoA dehydrogenase/3a,7a,12a-trihydroxy-5b-cholest-24-enoyl-CoA hydratase
MIRFDNKVVLITGAGAGLGRSYALDFAARGAKVLVNDLGGSIGGSSAADKVVAEITALGGEAQANYDDVCQGGRIVEAALDTYGRVDVLVNNAGILRDRSFRKMSDKEWDQIFDVHVRGAFVTTKAVWPHMLDQSYGRLIFTSSAAGMYGNFGQANYSAAKSALIGFGKTLALEGRLKNVHANIIAPCAGSRLLETILPKEVCDAMDPKYVAPLVTYLCAEQCEETGSVFEVGAGWFSKLQIQRSRGLVLDVDAQPIKAEALAENWSTVCDETNTEIATSLFDTFDRVSELIGHDLSAMKK